MKLIETTNITKIYGGKNPFNALNGVDLTLEQGESLAIVGKSGSGKSTLMHILALLDSPSSGTLIINGVDHQTLTEKKMNQIRNEQFGFVFQQFFTKPRESTLNNVLLPLEIAGSAYKHSQKERHQLALKALEAVDLVDKAKAPVSDLSGGQKQRVCIARAIINNPQVIFADEPTGNLDSKTSADIQDLLFHLHLEKGITLVVVTHDNDFAQKFDRQLYLHDGIITKELIK